MRDWWERGVGEEWETVVGEEWETSVGDFSGRLMDSLLAEIAQPALQKKFHCSSYCSLRRSFGCKTGRFPPPSVCPIAHPAPKLKFPAVVFLMPTPIDMTAYRRR